MLSRDDRSRDRHNKYRPGSKEHSPHALRPRPERMPTPHPAWHRAHALGPPQSWRPRRARDRGATITLSSSITSRISLSLTGPDCSRCRLALERPSAGGSTWQMALGHSALRPEACPMVRPTICHAGTPPAGPHCPLSRTSFHSFPTHNPNLRLLRSLSDQILRPCGRLEVWLDPLLTFSVSLTRSAHQFAANRTLRVRYAQ